MTGMLCWMLIISPVGSNAKLSISFGMPAKFNQPENRLSLTFLTSYVLVKEKVYSASTFKTEKPL